MAIVQSVALQLYQAWHWHLCDIATTYKVAEPDSVTDVESLIQLLEAIGKCPVEVMEIRTLLADMTPGRRSCWLPTASCINYPRYARRKWM